jgi:hypothetical protein
VGEKWGFRKAFKPGGVGVVFFFFFFFFNIMYSNKNTLTSKCDTIRRPYVQ